MQLKPFGFSETASFVSINLSAVSWNLCYDFMPQTSYGRWWTKYEPVTGTTLSISLTLYMISTMKQERRGKFTTSFLFLDNAGIPKRRKVHTVCVTAAVWCWSIHTTVRSWSKVNCYKERILGWMCNRHEHSWATKLELCGRSYETYHDKQLMNTHSQRVSFHRQVYNLRNDHRVCVYCYSTLIVLVCHRCSIDVLHRL
jgi:hypothetical protein